MLVKLAFNAPSNSLFTPPKKMLKLCPIRKTINVTLVPETGFFFNVQAKRNSHHVCLSLTE